MTDSQELKYYLEASWSDEDYLALTLILVIIAAFILHKSSNGKLKKKITSLEEKITSLSEEKKQLEEKIKELEYNATTYQQITHRSLNETLADLGTQGEYSLYQKLQHLEAEGKFLFNVYIPKADGTFTEVDMLYIHPTGIYIFENKNYSGWIFGNQKDKLWTESFRTGDKFRFYNPVMQNDGHIKYLRYYLKQSLPFFSVIVFSGTGELKNVTVNRTDVCLTTLEQVNQYITTVLNNSQHFLTSQQIECIYQQLCPLTQLADAARKKHIENVKDIQIGYTEAVIITNSSTNPDTLTVPSELKGASELPDNQNK